MRRRERAAPSRNLHAAIPDREYQAETTAPPGHVARSRSVPEPRVADARVQPARARAGRGQGHTSARAAALPVHRLVQHGRVLRDPRGGREGAAEARPRVGRPRRAHAAGDLRARQRGRAQIGRAPVRTPERRRPSRPRGRGHPLPAPRRVDARPAGVGARLLLPGNDAGADTHRPRSCASLPARLQQEPELRGGAGRARRVRPELARGHCPGSSGAAAGDPASARRGEGRARVHLPDLHPACARGRALHRHERARLPPVPRHAQLGPLRGRGGGEEPEEGAAGGAAAAPPGRRRAPRGRRHDDRGHGRVPARAARARRGRPLPRQRAGEPGAHDERAGPGGPRGPQVRRLPARAAQGAREIEGRLRDAPRGRYPAAPALPVLRAGDRLHPRGGPRPPGGRDQADRLPHRHRFGDHADPHRRRARRQGGHRRRRADGALRRGGQHQLGGQARGGRRARGLRRGGAQDPRQDGARGAARGGAAHALRAPGHGQLPPRARRASTPTSTSSRATPRSAPT